MIPKIACVGALTLDWIDTDGDRKGPFPAGNALYSAVGAWLAASAPIIVAHVGVDYPKTLLEEVSVRGLSIAGLRYLTGNSFRVLLKDRPTGREIRYLQDSGSSLDLDCGPGDLPFGQIDGVHVGPGRPAAQRAILDACRQRRCRTTLDLLFVNSEAPTKDEVLDLLPRTDAFLPSLQDMRRLWPAASLAGLLENMLGAGCRMVVLKMGARGCLASDGRRMLFLPAMPARIIDATGAGDAFCGAFHAQWIKTGDLSTSICWGAAAASIVVEGYGALHGLTDEAQERAQRRKDKAAPQTLDARGLATLFPMLS
jgi:ribokinase